MREAKTHMLEGVEWLRALKELAEGYIQLFTQCLLPCQETTPALLGYRTQAVLTHGPNPPELEQDC